MDLSPSGSSKTTEGPFSGTPSIGDLAGPDWFGEGCPEGVKYISKEKISSV